MTLHLTKRAIDLGIVVTDVERSLHFYRDVLGFDFVAETPMGGGATMQRLMCGDSMIKLVKLATNPPDGVPGGYSQATGLRYFTINCANVAEMAAVCERAGATIAVPPTELRPGVTICMVEDPDGNWVEFVHYADAG
ncbi:MAG: VOC family protein [Acidimicrobiales bacterium]